MTNLLAQRGILTRDQLGEELGLRPDTLLRWEGEGLPVVKHGQIALYNVDEVVAWITAKSKEKKARGKKAA